MKEANGFIMALMNVIYIKFDGKRAGTNLIRCNGSPFAREHRVVPIEPVLT